MNSSLDKLDVVVGQNCQQVLTVAGNPTEAQATPDFCSFNDGACSTTEANEDDFFTPTGVDYVASNLACVVDVAPAAGDDWTMTLRDDGANTTLTCQISDTATTCTDIANTPTITAGSKLNLDIESDDGASDPAAAALMECQLCIRPAY
jgi:hypothetical protein